MFLISSAVSIAFSPFSHVFFIIQNNSALFALGAHVANDKFSLASQSDFVIFANGFGYLFAKTIELNINETHNDGTDSISEARYSIFDAFDGNITTSLNEEKHNKI